MNVRRYFCVLAILLLYLCALAPATFGLDTTPDLTLPGYIAKLDALLSECKMLGQHPEQASEMSDQVASTWHIRNGEDSFDVSFEWLHWDLVEVNPDTSAEIANKITEHLEFLRAEATVFQNGSHDYHEERERLSGILAGGEFHDLHGSTWYDKLKQRLTLYLISLLGRVFGSSAIPTIGSALVYVLIGFAVLAVAYWMYRSIGKGAQLETVLPAGAPVSGKEWTAWRAEAQAAASRGNWREAMHLTYWCAIFFLEAQGRWQADSARTPREYLRLLPSTSAQWPTLAALTRSFEVVWYGIHRADAQTFSEALANLERLGCPSM